MKRIIKVLLILLAGAVGGVLASQFLLPYLSHTAPFDKIGWLKGVNNITTIINPKEEKIIKEDTAIEDAISKISPSTIGVVSTSTLSAAQLKKAGIEESIYGTGFLVTSDGLVITSSTTVPAKNYQTGVAINGEKLVAEVRKRDDNIGLILLKINKTNMPVVSFDDLNNLRLGERVVLVGADSSGENLRRFVDWGIVRSIIDKTFSISIEQLDPMASGAPLINVEGEVTGMALVGEDGNVQIVGADVIREFLEK